MYTDRLLMFSDNQVAATGPSTDTIDTGVGEDIWHKSRAIGLASRCGLFLHVIVGDADLTATALTVEMQHSNDNSTWETIQTYTSPTGAAFTAGSEVIFGGVPANTMRYIRLNFTFTGGPGTGTIFAFLNIDASPMPNYYSYP